MTNKTQDFKVGDKVVIDGVVSAIYSSGDYPIMVRLSDGSNDDFRVVQVRHAPAPDAEPVCWANFYPSGDPLAFSSKEKTERWGAIGATEIAVPLYRVAPDASKRIAELEKQVATQIDCQHDKLDLIIQQKDKIKSLEKEIAFWTEKCEAMRKTDKQAHILHLEGKLSAQRKVKKGLHDTIRDRNERIRGLESDVEFEKDVWRSLYAENQDLRDMITGKNTRIRQLEHHLAKASAFKSTPKPTCDTTCDTSDECCNTKPAEPAPTGDGDCDSVTVAPKGVKERIGCLVMEMRNSDSQKQRCEAAEEIWQSLKEIVELPKPVTDLVDWTNDAESWGSALNDACFAFMEAVQDPAEQSMWRNGKTALRAAILKYAALVQAANGGGK